MSSTTHNSGKSSEEKSGLAHWMARAPKEVARVLRKDFDADAVHDLRVALRRCRSLADVLMELDPDPAWQAMRKAASKLFKPLGELRDTQVAREWLGRLESSDEDPVRQKMLELLSDREAEAKTKAGKALKSFDRARWKQWARILPGHSRRIPPGGLALRHIALERWTEAWALHRGAARKRSQAALHEARIGVKKFRYAVENFLPMLHEDIGPELKRAQDLLGEIHDLDVLLPMLRETGKVYDADARKRWRGLVKQQRAERLAAYRALSRGDGSLWRQWRLKLPMDAELDSAALAKLRVWASFFDPNLRLARRLSDLAVQLFDGMAEASVNSVFTEGAARRIVRAGALLGNVGRAQGYRGHHKASYRLIRGFAPPLGWTAKDMLCTALVARYHRGTEPREGHEGFALLSPEERRAITWLAAVVRLADALVDHPRHSVTRLEVESSGGIHIWAHGYTADPDWAVRVLEKQRLLESVSGRPVFVRPAQQPALKARAAAG